MIVRLTNQQRHRIAGILAGPNQALLVEWLKRDAVASSRNRVDVFMPAIGWMLLERQMFNFCYDGRGFRGKGVKVCDFTALKNIRSAVNVREHHPALYGVSAMGAVGEIVPAWLLQEPNRIPKYSPYPVLGAPFATLVPEIRAVDGKRITSWIEAPRPSELPLLNETEHLRFTQ